MNWRITVERGGGTAAWWPARVSVPCPRGTRFAGYSVRGPDDAVAPAQARVLTAWPDGSPRWVQIDFQATATGPHVVQAEPAAGEPRLPVRAAAEGSRYSLAVGRLEVTVDAMAASPIAAIGWNGQSLAAGGWSFVAVDETGREFPLQPGSGTAPKVEAAGQHRGQVSWEMTHAGELLHARLRLEMLAGIEGFSLSYQFFHKQPAVPYLRLTRIEARCAFDGLAAGEFVIGQQHHSNVGTRRYVRRRQPVTLHLDRSRYGLYVQDPVTELDDDFAYPAFLIGSNQAVDAAVGLAAGEVAIVASVRDLECQRPKTITVAPGVWTVGIWPEDAGVLALPQGRSNRQVLDVRALPHETAALEAMIARPQAAGVEPALAWLDKADSHHAGPTWDQPRLFAGDEPGAAIFSHLLRQATSRWDTVAQMFDYGDTPDVGYMVSYPPTGRAPHGRQDYWFATNHTLHGLFHPPSTEEPVWTNNEYDAIYCLALEAIRTRDASALRKMTAAARHQLEVDFVHYHDHWQQHRATPQHSYDHNSRMSAIPSHQWTQGLYYYYAITGDDDAPEVIRAICDYNLDYLARDEVSFGLFFNRELGWALVALVFGYEATADPACLEMARRIIRKLQQDAGRTDFGDLLRKTSSAGALNATDLGIGFNTNTIPLGVKCYYQATGEAWARDLLCEWVAFGMTNFNRRDIGVKLSELFPESFAYVVELTGDPRYLRDSLWHLRLFFHHFNSLGWLDSATPLALPLTTKQYTRIYRGLVHFLSALCTAGYLPALEAALTAVPGLPESGPATTP